MYAPRPYKTKEEEIIEQNRNSEMISIPAHSTIGMVDGKLQVIDTPARQITNVGAGYLSGTDPVGEFVVGNVVAGKPLMWLGKGVEYGAARVGSQLARVIIISKTIDKGTPSVEPLPNNVGWGPRQSIHVVHDKNSARLPKLYFPERWDAIHEAGIKVNLAIQEQRLIILYQVRQRKQLRLEMRYLEQCLLSFKVTYKERMECIQCLLKPK